MLTVGDIVQLKSGGPKMTVVSVDMAGLMHCNWFDTHGNCLFKGFPVGSLNILLAKGEWAS